MKLLYLYLAAAALPVLAMPAGAADRFTIDPQHAFPSIEFSHMGLSVWRGKFDKSSGDITLDRDGKSGTVDIAIDPASVNFGVDAMDEKARSEDFFNVKQYPAATYRGTLKFSGGELKAVEGEVTLLGVTRPVTLTVNSFRCMPHPMLKKAVCGAGKVRRER